LKQEKDMAARDDRPRIASLGEWYEDLLKVDSTINARSEAQQASSLLCAKLQERESKVKERVRYLAAKRGLSFEEMWLKIIKDDYQKPTAEELQGIEALGGWEIKP
jgi:hypothetical protein